MCQMLELPPNPVLFLDQREWLREMAAWETRQPESVRAKNKRRKWRKIHDYAAERFGNAEGRVAGRFWYSVMMRAKANEAKFHLPTYWEQAHAQVRPGVGF